MKRLLQFLLHVDDPNRSACVKFLEENKKRVCQSPGSSKKHHAWSGGYLDHLADTMFLAKEFYSAIIKREPPLFSLGDSILILFLHDMEKPWKYVEPAKTFANDMSKQKFIHGMIEKYKITLSENQKNALKYVHGEGADYNLDQVVQCPLAAFCHLCDTASARIWPNRNPLTRK